MTMFDVKVLWKSKCLYPQSKNAAGRSHLLHDQQKLNPEAFVDLYQFHNKNFDSDPDAELYTVNGFLVLASDGSDINIPTTPETITTYGNASRNNTKLCTQIGLGCLYDTLSRMILYATILKVEQQALTADDEDVSIQLTKSRRAHYMGTADEAIVMSCDSFHLRMVRVWLIVLSILATLLKTSCVTLSKNRPTI